jgi:hypothetical protein
LVEEVASGVLTGDTTASVLERLERDAPHLSPVALRRVFVSFVWLIVFASLSVFCIEHADVMKDFNDLTGAAPFVVATAAASGTNRGWKALVPDSR